MAPCLSDCPFSHRTEEQGHVLGPGTTVSSYQGHRFLHLHRMDVAWGRVHLTAQVQVLLSTPEAQAVSSRYPKPPIASGQERRGGSFPKAVSEGGAGSASEPSSPGVSPRGREDDLAESPTIPQPEQPFPSPRWVEEHSLLPHLHGDKSAQRVM